MKVTLELLEQFNACSEGINFLKKNYPNGAEALEIMDNPNLTPSMLHFAAKFFPYNNAEFKRYQELCNIYDSENFFFSEYIFNSSIIVESKEVFSSKKIYNSQKIESSEEIYNSRHIDKSQDIFNSYDVNNSKLVIDSKEIENSEQIYASDKITNCGTIMNSLNLNNCNFVYQSSNSYECYFSGFLTNCNRCLFCSGLDSQSNMIFNIQVSSRDFDRIKELVFYWLEEEKSQFIQVIKDYEFSREKYIVKNKFDYLFNGLSADFFGRIGTLSQFNEEIFYQVFLTPDILKNIKNLDII